MGTRSPTPPRRGTQGYVLQTLYNLRFGGSYYTNGLGQNEKWLEGTTNANNNPWYILLPNGQFYAWNGASGAAALKVPGTNAALAPLATLDLPALYWTYPTLHYQNSANNDLNYAILQGLGLHVSGSLYTNSAGYGESWLMDSTGAWCYIQANGQLFQLGRQRPAKNQDALLATA